MTKPVCIKTFYGATSKELSPQESGQCVVSVLHKTPPERKAPPTLFKCVKSTSSSKCTPKVGDVIEGELIHIQREHGIDTRIVISNVGDRMGANGRPYWNIGEKVPLKGSIWIWEEVK